MGGRQGRGDRNPKWRRRASTKTNSRFVRKSRFLRKGFRYRQGFVSCADNKQRSKRDHSTLSLTSLRALATSRPEVPRVHLTTSRRGRNSGQGGADDRD